VDFYWVIKIAKSMRKQPVLFATYFAMALPEIRRVTADEVARSKGCSWT